MMKYLLPTFFVITFSITANAKDQTENTNLQINPRVAVSHSFYTQSADGDFDAEIYRAALNMGKLNSIKEAEIQCQKLGQYTSSRLSNWNIAIISRYHGIYDISATFECL